MIDATCRLDAPLPTALAPGTKPRVLVAMSGGVDSSLAAALVVEAGYEAIGVSMHLAGDSSRCCSRGSPKALQGSF